MLFVDAAFKSEMALDLRSATERQNIRYNIDAVTLNTDLEVFKSKPKLYNRQGSNGTQPVAYHLEA